MTKKMIIVLGNGKFTPSVFFEKLAKKNPLIAVDGGANHCKKYGYSPHTIIGDLDSVTQETQHFFTQNGSILETIADQNSTDFEKMLAWTSSEILFCFGFTGNFFDHSLSLLHILQKNEKGEYGNGVKKIFIFTENQVFCVIPRNAHFSVPFPEKKSQRISFYPLTPSTFTSSVGFAFPLDGLTLEQGKMIGTSNFTQGDFLGWEMKEGCCLGFFPIEWALHIFSSVYGFSLD